MDVQNAIKVLEKHCTPSDKSQLLKKLEQSAATLIQLAQNRQNLDQLVKQYFKQAVKKSSHLSKPCEIYFYHVIYHDLFPLICAQNQAKDLKLNQQILTNLSLKSNRLRQDLQATIPGTYKPTCPSYFWNLKNIIFLRLKSLKILNFKIHI